MFCQLISADTPPRLISNVGYFENDRFFLSTLASIVCGQRHTRASRCRSDPAIFSTNRQVVRAKCHRDCDGAAIPCKAHGNPHSYLALCFFPPLDAQLTRVWLTMVEPGASIVVELPCSPSRRGAIPGLAKPALSYPSHPEMKMTTGPAETGPTVSQFPDDRRLPVVWRLVSGCHRTEWIRRDARVGERVCPGRGCFPERA